MQRKISGATKSWSVSRIMLTPCTGRSLAVHIALPSAIGNASRRIAVFCPCEASRANNFLAGRSRAASACRTGPFVATPERDQREPERSDGSSRARSAATRSLLWPIQRPRPMASALAFAGARREATRSLQPAAIRARPVRDGLGRFDDFAMQWNGNAACVVAV